MRARGSKRYPVLGKTALRGPGLSFSQVVQMDDFDLEDVLHAFRGKDLGRLED